MKNFNKVLERVDSLKQYIYRYLRTEDNIRTNSFIRILLRLPDADYNPLRLARYTKKYIDNLKNTKFIVTQQISEVEIIPFDHLLDILFELLENIKK